MAGEIAPYLAQLRRSYRDEDALFVAAKQVEELTRMPGWEVLTGLLGDVHGNAMERLLAGHAGSEGRILEQAEYARLVGFLSGLSQPRIAAEAIATAAERVRKANERPDGA